MQPQPFLFQLQPAQAVPQMPESARQQGVPLKGISGKQDAADHRRGFSDDLRTAEKQAARSSRPTDSGPSRTDGDHRTAAAKPKASAPSSGNQPAWTDESGENSELEAPDVLMAEMGLGDPAPLAQIEAVPVYVDPDQRLFVGEALPRQMIDGRRVGAGGPHRQSIASGRSAMEAVPLFHRTVTGGGVDPHSAGGVFQAETEKAAADGAQEPWRPISTPAQSDGNRQTDVPTDMRPLTAPAAGRDVGAAGDGKGVQPATEENGNAFEKRLHPLSRPAVSSGQIQPGVERAGKSEAAPLQFNQTSGPTVKPETPGEGGSDPAARAAAGIFGAADSDSGATNQGLGDHNADFRHPGSTAETAATLKGGDETPPAEKGAELPKFDRADMMQQVVKRAALSIQNGQTEVQLQLKPEFLGEMRLQITTENQQVSIRISAELASVKEILETHLHQLKAELNNQGVAVGELEVSVADDSGRQGQRPAHPTRVGPRKPAQAELQADTDGRNEPETSRRSVGAATDGRKVDYFA